MMSSKKKFKLSYWIVFILAVFALSEFFGAHKYFASGSSANPALMILLSLLVFALCVVYLSYQVYAEEKDQNNLRVSFGPFEYLYKKLGANNGKQ